MVSVDNFIKKECGVKTMVYIRKDELVVGECYHIYSKSIAGYKIFNNDSEFERMLTTIRYYQNEKPDIKLSAFIRIPNVKEKLNKWMSSLQIENKLVDIIAYCIMPTHLHLILKQLKKDGISIFMSNVLNSYSRYFNIKHNRKGPLWKARFKNVLVESDEQMLHLTRYIHLNPVTAYLVNKPEEWAYSSYREYLTTNITDVKICNYADILDIDPATYKEFVEDQISYQRDLAKLKDIAIDHVPPTRWNMVSVDKFAKP